VTFSAEEYVKAFGGFPVKGKTVDYNAYVTGKVLEVSEKGAVVEFSSKTDEIEERFGTTRIRQAGDRIEVSLTPKMGAEFSTKDRTGTIVSADDRQFTVDFSSPVAGKNIVFDVTVQSVVKADAFKDMQIDWIDDYAEGLAALDAANKPAVLVLYADWCGYCKKLLTKTMEDPRIRMMRDDFIWVKANSDKEQSLKELYGQKGFPLTVVLDGNGEIIGRIDGFRPPAEYRAALQKLMKTDHKAAAIDDGAVESGS
jgi:thioredoxin-related protein